MATNKIDIQKANALADILSNTYADTSLISEHYIAKLFLYIVLWFFLLLMFIWVIDPYGVAPFHLNLPRINVNKPMRLDIDRLIKPFEVWRYQPKTVFLGTSRIHQSIDPTLFNNTTFAPAYNAAIPASTLNENAAHIEQYLRLDPNIKDIFIELFFYNFTTQQSQQSVSPKTWKKLIGNVAPLQMSSDALIDAIKTIASNRNKKSIPAHIDKLGFRVPASDFNPADTFSDVMFTRTVLAWDRASRINLQPSAIEALDRIVNIARQHNVKLHMLLTPNYPWDDYRLVSLGYWPLLEKWIRQMATYSDVISFSQYNELLEEPPTSTPKMKWWNDPTHFSLNMGKMMMNAYLGHPEPGTPANLMRHLNPSTVESVIAERKAGALRWAAAHPDFVTYFEEAKTMSDTVTGTLNVNAKTLTVNGRNYPIVLGVGSATLIDPPGAMMSISGWAADEVAKRRVTQLIATIGSTVVARGEPTANRADINFALGKTDVPTGFNIQIPLEHKQKAELIRIFALMQDGRAVQLTSEIPQIDGRPVISLGSVTADTLVINNQHYPIMKRDAGAIEKVIPTWYGYSVYGWAADTKAHTSVIAIFAAVGSQIVSKELATASRDDIASVPKTIPSGFIMNVPMSAEQMEHKEQFKLYALMSDGVVSPL